MKNEHQNKIQTYLFSFVRLVKVLDRVGTAVRCRLVGPVYPIVRAPLWKKVRLGHVRSTSAINSRSFSGGRCSESLRWARPSNCAYLRTRHNILLRKRVLFEANKLPDHATYLFSSFSLSPSHYTTKYISI